MENVSGDVGRLERQGRLLWILRAATALIDFMADDEVSPPIAIQDFKAREAYVAPPLRALP